MPTGAPAVPSSPRGQIIDGRSRPGAPVQRAQPQELGGRGVVAAVQVGHNRKRVTRGPMPSRRRPPCPGRGFACAGRGARSRRGPADYGAAGTGRAASGRGVVDLVLVIVGGPMIPMPSLPCHVPRVHGVCCKSPCRRSPCPRRRPARLPGPPEGALRAVALRAVARGDYVIRESWDRLAGLPGGKRIFSGMVGLAAPYTATIVPMSCPAHGVAAPGS